MADQPSVGFTYEAARRIGRVVQQVERSPRFPVDTDRGYKRGWTGTKIARTKIGGIAKMTGTTPGTADVVLYTFDDESGTLIAGETVKAFNCWRTVIAATTWVHLVLIDNRWFVSAEDC